MRRLGILVLALAFGGLAFAQVQGRGGIMSTGGRLMGTGGVISSNPGLMSNATASSSSGQHILAENADRIAAENGDLLVTE